MVALSHGFIWSAVLKVLKYIQLPVDRFITMHHCCFQFLLLAEYGCYAEDYGGGQWQLAIIKEGRPPQKNPRAND